MLRVVCPFVPGKLASAAARTALREQAPHVEFVDVSSSPTSYHSLLARLWRDGETFALIEHDIVLPPGTIAALDACPHPWCVAPPTGWAAHPERAVHEWMIAALQCNRWRSSFLLEHSDAIDSIAPIDRHWFALDCYSVGRLAAHPHIHADLLTTHTHIHSLSERDARRESLAAYRQHYDAEIVEA